MSALPPLSDAIEGVLPPEVQAYLAALVAENALLRSQVATLTAQVATLTARLGQSSANSSRPPSSDPPRTPAPPQRPSGRRPGGQPGHPGHGRALVAAAQVAQIITCVPTACRGCGAALAAVAAADDPAPVRHQVWELPPVAVTVTEDRLAARRCGGCGQTTRAALPDGVTADGCGPRLTAVSATLSGRYRLSKRETSACLGDVFGAEVSVGTVSALEQTVSAALEPVVAAVAAAIQQAPVVNMDETPWREARRRVWLWTVVAVGVTLFQIHASRGGAVARALLGEAWSGIVGSDRGTMESWLERECRQVCWAHLKRNFQKLVDWGPGPRPVGERLLAIEVVVFRHWRRFRAGELDRAGLQAALEPVQAAMTEALRVGATTGHPVAQSLCRSLLTVEPALWTFLTVPGVEPTNNRAEQALRPAVLWRKGSFGTHSPAGSRFVERMLTVTASCRQQDRPLLTFIEDAVRAARIGTPPPSLLPSAG